jgi:hypothetical protein
MAFAWLKPAWWRRRSVAWRAGNKDRFTTLFVKERWVSEESASGPGSDRRSDQVAHALRVLAEVAEAHDIRSMADIPCGDFNWIGDFLTARPRIAYVGYDIVDDLIAQNRKRHPEQRFEALDITAQVPPAVDLIFSKDLINHLFDRDVWAALDNMVASGSRWLLITSNTGAENSELELMTPRSSRLLDLRAAPWGFPEPTYADHYLSLWRIEDLKPVLARRPQGFENTGEK